MSTPLGPCFWPLPPLLPTHLSSAWGLCHSPSVVPSTVAPRSPVQSPTLGKNVLTTCSLASGSSKAVAPSIWISGIPLSRSEYASSLAVDPGTFPGHSWWSTQSTATTSAPPRVRRSKSWPHCQSTSKFLDWNQHQQNVNRAGSHTRTSQTLPQTSPVLPSNSGRSQAPLEVSKVLSDSARAFSGAPESTCSVTGVLRCLLGY